MQIGPRLELEVIKAEEGLCSGRVLFHAHVQKDPEAAQQQQAAVDESAATQEQRERLRAARRNQQVNMLASCLWKQWTQTVGIRVTALGM